MSSSSANNCNKRKTVVTLESDQLKKQKTDNCDFMVVEKTFSFENKYEEFTGGSPKTNQLCNHRFLLQKKIGKGSFSHVWLAHDIVEDRFVAIKFCNSDSFHVGISESNILKSMTSSEDEGRNYCVRLLDRFIVMHPENNNLCLVFEYLNQSLTSVIQNYKDEMKKEITALNLPQSDANQKYQSLKRLPLHFVKIISRQILQSAEFFHESSRVIHTDLKPDNILLTRKNQFDNIVDFVKSYDSVSLDTKEAECVVIDFGSACPINHPHTNYVTTRYYRAPESICRCSNYDEKIDIFSIACIIYELATGGILFLPRIGMKDNKRITLEEDHYYQIFGHLGNPEYKLPIQWFEESQFSGMVFNEDHKFRTLYISDLKFMSLRERLIEMSSFDQEEAIFLTSFLIPMLELDSKKRISAKDASKHPWLQFETAQQFGEQHPQEWVKLVEQEQKYVDRIDACKNSCKNIKE